MHSLRASEQRRSLPMLRGADSLLRSDPVRHYI
jgi:hypothetical protein